MGYTRGYEVDCKGDLNMLFWGIKRAFDRLILNSLKSSWARFCVLLDVAE